MRGRGGQFLARWCRARGDGRFLQPFIGLRHASTRALAEAGDHSHRDNRHQSEQDNIFNQTLARPTRIRSLHASPTRHDVVLTSETSPVLVTRFTKSEHVFLVETKGIEPSTSAMPLRRSPS